MNNKSLEVICIYRSSLGREIEFNYVKDGSDVMDEVYHIDQFWNVDGGFSITVGNYCNVLRETNFYVLLKPVTFLLHSLYWMKGLNSDWFDTDDAFPSSVVIRTMSQESIVLSKNGASLLSLSFFPPINERVLTRGKHYFSGIEINAGDWEKAATIALEEYFYLYEKLLAQSTTPSIANEKLEFLGLWHCIRQ